MLMQYRIGNSEYAKHETNEVEAKIIGDVLKVQMQIMDWLLGKVALETNCRPCHTDDKPSSPVAEIPT